MNSSKCSKCGSAWVYMIAWGGCDVHNDRCACSSRSADRPFCKPCLYAYAKDEGYFDGFDDLLRSLVERTLSKEEPNEVVVPTKRKYKKRGEDPDGQGNLLKIM